MTSWILRLARYPFRLGPVVLPALVMFDGGCARKDPQDAGGHSGGETGAHPSTSAGQPSSTANPGATSITSIPDSGFTSSSTGVTNSDGFRFDLGMIGDAPIGDTGCQKIDFLFVIDNSTSMIDEQQNLIASFPGFIESIQTTLGIDDFHIMVVDTDARLGALAGCSMGSPTAPCGDWCNDCQAHGCQCECAGGCEPLPACDVDLGAARNKDRFFVECGIVGDGRFLTSEQPNLTAAFECLALVGATGLDFERPMEAMVEALTTHAQAGGCNEGFLRDDAILVVTFITDEDDQGGGEPGGSNPYESAGSPNSWRDALIAVKGGNDEAVVVLGLVGDSGLAAGLCEPPNGGEGADDAPTLRTFAESWRYGSWASVCLADYSPFFTDGTRAVVSSCETFTPPG